MKLDWIVFTVSTMVLASGCRMAVTNNYPVCDSEASAVRMHAASDFRCAMSDISVRPTEGDKSRFVANGCGQSVVYFCPHDDPYGRCQREGVTDVTPVMVEPEPVGASATVSTPVSNGDAEFRASLKLVLESIPYRDCGVGESGKIQITFDQSGVVTNVAVVSGNYDASTTACLVARFRGVHAPPSTGKRVAQWGIHLDGTSNETMTKGSWDE